MYVSHAPDPMATNGEDTPVAPAPTPASPGYAVSSGSPYASVDVVDELSVDGMYRRYGQRRYSGEAPPRAPTLAEVVADPNNPEFDLERSMQATAEESRQQGWHSPPQTLTFQNLSVSVPQQDTHIPTYSTALVGVFKQPYTMIKEGSMFDKLVDINGYCRPGEMLLVMGPPGSGCSTLLKVLSGRRKNLKVGGQILYNGSPDYERLSLALIGEEDNHLPSLTVEQTLQFAMDMLMPREIPHRKDAKYVENVMRLLGLYRVKDTVVGDSMLRGVSGGEKKRVTIGEMLLGRARIFCYDGWSKGLDAAAALDICKITRVVANTLRNTVIMSQYQASGEMFDIFDNLLLLDGGRQVYFGPIKGAVQYFGLLGLRCPPRRTIPDFLATAVDRVAEVTIPGYTPPITKEGFADAFKESDAYRAVIQEIEATNRQPPPEGHLCAEAKAANERFYATPFKYQLKRLIARERLVLWQNAKTFIVPRISQMTMMGLILGLLFLKLGNTQKGAYSKTGALFQALTFIGFSSFSFMPALLLARGVFYKQKDAKFFRPMAWFLSKTLSDLPFTVLDVVLFGVIVYWMIGFYASVERFLFFELTLWLTNLTFSNLIRLFGCIGSDLSAAQALSAAFVLVFVFFSGFMIPMNKLPVVLKWLYWVSPLHYPLHALLLNEFMPLTLHCNPNEMTPSEEVLRKQGVNGSVAPYQICTIPGNPTGPRTGAGYLSASYGIDDAESFKWVDLLILAAFLFFFIGLAAIAVVKVDFGSQSSLMRYKRKRRDEEHEPSAEELDETQSQDFGTCKPAFVTWTSLSYQVPKPGKKRAEGDATITLLQEVFGYCNPRNMIALMGASGAGKTTLLDVLAMRKTGGKITGDIMVNGVRQDKSFKRYAGYVEQEDIHQPMTTVREALKFAARLRLPADAGEAKIEETVKSTMLLLGLTKIADALVGSAETGGGIPMEARKRLTIGVELVANPSILFMDEPTSGLDTRGALKVMKAARRIADSGRSVICTIHQPSAELFELFDSLLLLARGGRTVYFGPIGENSSTLIQYFEHKGAHPCPENYNPADYILDVIGSGLTRKQGDKDWASIWNHSSQCKETVTHLQQRDFLPPDVTPFEAHSSMFPSTRQQFLALAGRTIRVFWRTPSYNFIRHVFAIAVGLLLGSSYFQLGDTQTDLQQYVSALFFAVFLGALGMMNAMVPIFTERAVFNREVANGSYRRHIYSGVYSLVELPFTVVSALLFVNIFFWMVGLPSGGDRYLFALLDFFVFQLFSVFMGQAIAAVAPSLQVALGVAPLLMSFWILHLGFLIPKSEIPAYFIEFNIVNPYKFFMRSFVASTLRDKPFRCTEGQYLEFPIPPKGCPTEPAATWSSTATHCRLCPQTSGDRFLDFYGWSASTRWTDLLILVACCFAFRVITTVAMTKRQYATR